MTRAFYYDIVCPYAYMAFSFLKKNDAFRKNAMELRPILLGGLFGHLKSNVNPNKTLSTIKANYLATDIKRQAHYFDVSLQFHPRHPVSTVAAMRLIHAAEPERRELLSERLYQAYWQENLDIDDDSVIKNIAKDFGVGDKESYYKKAKASLIDRTSAAFEHKVFGVPTIALNDRLYFGGDRLQLIEQELGIKLPDVPWRAGQEEIEFYFDFSSPYSYLAWAEVTRARALGVNINPIPVLLGAIFKERGVDNVPMLSAHPYKTAYFLQDMKDFAQHRKVSFQFNSHFPLRTVTPLRVALIDPRVIDPIFAAAWAHDRGVADPDILLQVLNLAGFDGEKLIKQSEDDLIKEKLKTNTTRALGRGVFGVPTFFVKENLVFGQDRFPWIKLKLSQ